MLTNKPFDEIVASKRLSRLKVHIRNEAVDIDVIWCRTVYNQHEKWNKRKHRHTFLELHYALEGSCDLIVNTDQTVKLSNNNFIVIPSNCFHRIADVSSDFSEFVIGFNVISNIAHPDGAFLKNAFEKLLPNLLYSATPQMHTLVSYVLENTYYNRPGLTTVITSLLNIFIINAAQQICPHYKSEYLEKKIFENDIRIERAEKFIEDNISEKITGEDVAQQVKLSVKQLNRLLQQNSNTTINELIEQAKVNHIRYLLTNTNLSLDQISEKVGYSNGYNLSRFFKRVEGMTPGQYRRSMEK